MKSSGSGSTNEHEVSLAIDQHRAGALEFGAVVHPRYLQRRMPQVGPDATFDATGSQPSGGGQTYGQGAMCFALQPDLERPSRLERSVELLGPERLDSAGGEGTADHGPVSLDETHDAVDRNVLIE